MILEQRSVPIRVDMSPHRGDYDRLHTLWQNQSMEIERLNKVLREKCEESENWMFKALHLEQHLNTLSTFE